MVLPQAVLESVARGFFGALVRNPRTGAECVVRLEILGLCFDTPRVRRCECSGALSALEICVATHRSPHLYFSQRSQNCGIAGCNHKFACTACLQERRRQDDGEPITLPPMADLPSLPYEAWPEAAFLDYCGAESQSYVIRINAHRDVYVDRTRRVLTQGNVDPCPPRPESDNMHERQQAELAAKVRAKLNLRYGREVELASHVARAVDMVACVHIHHPDVSYPAPKGLARARDSYTIEVSEESKRVSPSSF
jgi:hypothetical protein